MEVSLNALPLMMMGMLPQSKTLPINGACDDIGVNHGDFSSVRGLLLNLFLDPDNKYYYLRSPKGIAAVILVHRVKRNYACGGKRCQTLLAIVL